MVKEYVQGNTDKRTELIWGEQNELSKYWQKWMNDNNEIRTKSNIKEWTNEIVGKIKTNHEIMNKDWQIR